MLLRLKRKNDNLLERLEAAGLARDSTTAVELVRESDGEEETETEDARVEEGARHDTEWDEGRPTKKRKEGQ
jgi:hypothetical protein